MGSKPWTIKGLLEVSAGYLEKKGVEPSRLSAEILLAYQLGMDRVSLYVNFDKPLSDNEVSGYRAFIRRRSLHEPIQYITGTQEFWSLDFNVDSRVLIPRAETELLVELALQEFRNKHALQDDSTYRILELGTGCGAIAVSLAKELSGVEIWATDISPEALEVALRNAEKHGVRDFINFKQGDLLSPVAEMGTYFDMIITNPPYVAEDEYEGLPAEVRDYEPSVALKGKEGGLFFIKRIIRESPPWMKPGACLLIETAPAQISEASDIIGDSDLYEKPDFYRDYSRNYRAVVARKARK